jgi:hypothetical protein
MRNTRYANVRDNACLLVSVLSGPLIKVPACAYDTTVQVYTHDMTMFTLNVLIPITSPSKFNSGPPELPRLIAASVYIGNSSTYSNTKQ